MLHKTIYSLFVTILFTLIFSAKAFAFCGFYASKADSTIYNNNSTVIMMRDKDRTVITMMNDYEGDIKEFAMIIPIPQIIGKDQINVIEKKIVEELDDFTAPRLTEYIDSDNLICDYKYMIEYSPQAIMQESSKMRKEFKVKIEARYDVDEYDIIILSADDSDNLLGWLKENNYKIPANAEKIVNSYIKQKNKFFIAKIDLDELEKFSSDKTLRPLQIAFESPKFMLPIRLGTVNSKASQNLTLITLTRTGQTEPTNYPLAKMPSGKFLPFFAKKQFATIYPDIFKTQVKKKKSTIFLEYAGDIGFCDPCVTTPPSKKSLVTLGAFWLLDNNTTKSKSSNTTGSNSSVRINFPFIRPPQVFLTRMHAEYNSKTFPADIKLAVTSQKDSFQTIYHVRKTINPLIVALSILPNELNSYAKSPSYDSDREKECPPNTQKAMKYLKQTISNFQEEMDTLQTLSGWSKSKIEKQIQKSLKYQKYQTLHNKVLTKKSNTSKNWWNKIWPTY